MGMKFHVKAALDILSKGLDPTVAYSRLGPDGMLAVPPIPGVQPKAPAVVASLEPAVVPEPVVVPVLPSSPEPVEPASSELLVVMAVDPVEGSVTPSLEPQPPVTPPVTTSAKTVGSKAGRKFAKTPK